jgi:hypothetical protein
MLFKAKRIADLNRCGIKRQQLDVIEVDKVRLCAAVLALRGIVFKSRALSLGVTI